MPGRCRELSDLVAMMEDRDGSNRTFARAINNGGFVIGNFVDGTNADHGFLRAADETFTPSDVKGAVWTEILAINNTGAIAETPL